MKTLAFIHRNDASLPAQTLSDGRGSVRVIAGNFGGQRGPAQTHTRLTLLDLTLQAGASVEVETEPGDTALLYLLSGALVLPDDQGTLHTLSEQGLAVLSQREAGLCVQAQQASRVLVLCGERIDEPLNGHGPFVMNTYEEVLQAYADFKAGKLG